MNTKLVYQATLMCMLVAITKCTQNCGAEKNQLLLDSIDRLSHEMLDEKYSPNDNAALTDPRRCVQCVGKKEDLRDVRSLFERASALGAALAAQMIDLKTIKKFATIQILREGNYYFNNNKCEEELKAHDKLLQFYDALAEVEGACVWFTPGGGDADVYEAASEEAQAATRDLGSKASGEGGKVSLAQLLDEQAGPGCYYYYSRPRPVDGEDEGGWVVVPGQAEERRVADPQVDVEEEERQKAEVQVGVEEKQKKDEVRGDSPNTWTPKTSNEKDGKDGKREKVRHPLDRGRRVI